MGIQYRKGICTCHNDERLIVKRLPGRQLCQVGNETRLEEKRGKKVQKPIRSKKKPTGEGVLFMTIWNTRPKVSFLSGENLAGLEGTDLWVNTMAHVLPKSKYKDFRLKAENIVLLTPDEHFLFDQGYEEQREKYAEENGFSWQPLYDLRDELKLEYAALATH